MIETTCPVVIETLEQTDNEAPELKLKYKHVDAHGIQTLKCLDAMRKERQLCDVILMVEGHELFAHRALLSCHSNYFLELFLNDENDASKQRQLYYQIDGLEYMPVKLMIQFIYRGSFHLTSELVPKIYLAAHQLRIESIFKACSIYLCEQLNENNCLSTRILAIDDNLREKANECIQTNFTAVIETREFQMLPMIKLELIDSKAVKSKVICDLVINWVAQQLSKDNNNLQGLCENIHVLYLNGEILHDCVNMDNKNVHFLDIVKDYQSYKLTKRSLSTSSSSSSTQNDSCILEIPSLQMDSNNILTSNSILSLQYPETKLIHMSQSNDHSYVAIAIIKGKILVLSIHTSAKSNPTTPDVNESTLIEKAFDEHHSYSNSPRLSFEKDVTLGSMLTARCGFGIASIDNMINIVGGYNRSDCLNTIEQFDPVENKWKLLPFTMSIRRGRVSAAIVDNQLYVFGGSDGHKELKTGECFDLKSMNKWSPLIKELPIPVARSAMCNDNNFVYLIGGIEGDKCRDTCYQYNPKDSTWTDLAPMNTERSEAGATYYNDKLYVFGGTTLSRCLSSCEILSLSTNEWMAGPAMKEHRRGCGVVLYHDKIYVIGGSNGVTSLTSIEIFDPIAEEWIIDVNGTQNELNIPRVGLGVTVCSDKMYAIGGFDGRTFLKSIEVYDEHAQQWRLSYNHISSP